MPDLLHVVPVGDDAVLDGVLEGEDTSLGLSLVSNVRVFLSHTHHHALMPGASDDGGEHSPRGVISGETGFTHARAIVYNKSSYFVVTHLVLFVRSRNLVVGTGTVSTGLVLDRLDLDL